jgi:gliding motility-associated-like protein
MRNWLFLFGNEKNIQLPMIPKLILFKSKAIILIMICFLCNKLQGQVITGVVNSYASVNTITNNIVNVNSAAGFLVGDKVMLIKMKGATIANTNNNNYGDITNIGDAGRYIISKIVRVNGNDITLSSFCNIFSNSNFLQLVKIPVFTNPTVNGSVTCAPWNGTTGGVLAFEATGIVTLNGSILADGQGFRGGDVLGAGTQCGDLNYFSPLVAFGPNGKKGEGIADYITLQECGRGKLANGGGGAHASNSGAGGGGNIGAGGDSGNETDTCFTLNNKSIGGASLPQSNNRLFMGGGGGAPQNNDNQIVPNGGSGGGIIYIKATEIVGNGFDISSRGVDVPTTNDEGAPGGGAGGSVVLDCNNFSSFLFVDVAGGSGGDVDNILFPNLCQGTGGGGGGGLIYFSTATTPATVITSIGGGSAGFIQNFQAPCFGTSYGAEDGEEGALRFNYNLPVPINNTTVNIGNDTVMCGNTSIVLDAGSGYDTYLWHNNTTNQTTTVNTIGNYFITVYDNGCTASDTIKITPDTTIQANFVYTLKYGCDADTIVFKNTSIGAFTYEWDFNDPSSPNNSSFFANPTHIFANQGTYNIRLVAKDLPCTDTIIVPITIFHPLSAMMTFDDKICEGDSVLVLGKFLSVPLTDVTYTFDWDDGTTTTAPSGNAWHTYPTPGQYAIQLILTDTLGCTARDTMILNVSPRNFAFFATNKDSICVGQSILFTDSVPASTQRFIWDFGDNETIEDVHNPVHPYDKGGNYIVSLTATEIFQAPNQPVCPSFSVTKNITVLDYPAVNLGKDTSYCPGVTNPLVINNTINPNEILQWSDGQSAASLIVNSPGRFWATKSNGFCSTTDSIEIKQDCYVTIPNSFSPDGDGLNDFFFPRANLSSGVKSMHLMIYNRWGKSIFETKLIDGQGWDGKYNNVLQPMGVYIYTLEVVFINNMKKNYKGNVTLIR